MTDSTSSSRRVAVFTKSLDSPEIKTRLAQQIGFEKARACYATTLAKTIAAVSAVAQGIIYADGLITDTNWLQDLPVRQQTSGDLGERMLACFIEGVSIVIGGDCPLVTSTYIQRALNLLEVNDVVLGPTEDGGYFLIGMSEPHSDLLLNMAWSHDRVLSETLTRADKRNLKVALLPMVWDVDDKETYERWLNLQDR